MNSKLLRFTAIFFLTLLMGGPALGATDEALTVQQSQDKAMAILKRSADFLAQAKQYSVTVDSGFDLVQPSGQKTEVGETRKVSIRRPDRARIDFEKRDGSKGSFIFDGKEIIFYTTPDNVYARTPKPTNLDDALLHFTHELKMRLPLAELFSSTLPDFVARETRQARYVGKSAVAGIPCEHLALRTDEVDYQVWVASGKEPLPIRLIITYKHQPSQPQFWAQLTSWNLSPKISDSVFAFTPPAGAKKISFVTGVSPQTVPAGQKGGKQ